MTRLVPSRSCHGLLLVLMALFLLLPSRAARAEIPVDLQLVLAVDASSSVDFDEFNLMANGLAHAFRDERVKQAISSGALGAIAVTVVQWASAGTNAQHVSVPWQLVDGPEASEALADRLQMMPRDVDGGGTSIGNAIRYSMQQFSVGPYRGLRQVIEVSGDGIDNGVDPVRPARDDAVAQGITINGLAILNEEKNLDRHYQDYVIGGRGAFVIDAADYADFARAILQKLIREISDVPIARNERAPAAVLAAR